MPLIVIGISIVIWGRITMLAAGTNINPSQPAVALVTSGPFRFSRNPLYTALMLVFSGLTLAFNTWRGVRHARPRFHRHVFGSDPPGGTIPRAEIRRQLPGLLRARSKVRLTAETR
jgi:hypothetical protein